MQPTHGMKLMNGVSEGIGKPKTVFEIGNMFVVIISQQIGKRDRVQLLICNFRLFIDNTKSFIIFNISQARKSSEILWL